MTKAKKKPIEEKPCPVCGWTRTTYHPASKCQANIQTRGYGPNCENKPTAPEGTKKNEWDNWGAGSKDVKAEDDRPKRPGLEPEPQIKKKPGDEPQYEFNIGMELFEGIGAFLNDTTQSDHYALSPKQRADLSRALDAIGNIKTENPWAALIGILFFAWVLPLIMFKEDRDKLVQGVKDGWHDLKEALGMNEEEEAVQDGGTGQGEPTA